ncbi:hypothetical protein QCA50_001023 [Cerrena zonata]|uniref:Protein phosphatase n=1 Tax=Cerrena zonata TaxID=2478898 RepID=A0AAW0H0Q8_9APHY
MVILVSTPSLDFLLFPVPSAAISTPHLPQSLSLELLLLDVVCGDEDHPQEALHCPPSPPSRRRLFYNQKASTPLLPFPSLTRHPSPHTTGARPPSTNLSSPPRQAKLEVETHTPYSQHQNNNGSQSGTTGNTNQPPGQSQSQSNQPPYPLAFTTAQSDASSSFYPHTSTAHYNIGFPYPFYGPVSWIDTAPTDLLESTYSPAKQGTRYHLDVGAYGIPKRGGDVRIAGCDGRGGLPFGVWDRDLGKDRYASVLVGEDAYFVRDNAMGVADGVGGWSKLHKQVAGKVDDSSPSAMFAQHLMHYCSEEVDAATSSIHSEYSSLEEELEEELEDSLEDLTDGLDVLMILERAYEKTMKAHVKPSESPTPSTTSPACDGQNTTLEPSKPNSTHTVTPSQSAELSSSTSTQSSPYEPKPSASVKSTFTSASASTPSLSSEPTPLREGSATALVAILDHAPAPAPLSNPSNRTLQSSATASRVPSSSSSFFYPRPRVFPSSSIPMNLAAHGLGKGNEWNGKVNGNAGAGEEMRAVMRIAHLGDCMGMLIRKDEIVWRTEEMWWNFNTPLQLGPASRTKPQDAKVFTIPVQEDDILVLASDGLSDNLWDEEILDEVVRFRRSFMGSSSSTPGERILGRRTLAGMLSEALCSRARSVSERQGKRRHRPRKSSPSASSSLPSSSSMFGGVKLSSSAPETILECEEDDEVPFARRAREEGRSFSGGKMDDISVLIAVVSPAEMQSPNPATKR